MRWFRGHKVVTVAIIIALVLTIIIVASYKLQGKNNAVGRVAGGIISTLQKPISIGWDFVSEGASGFFTSDELEKKNEDLKEEVRQLEGNLIKEKLNAEELEELQNLSATLGNLGLDQESATVVASVIALDKSNYFDIFTIDAGNSQGIKVNSVVITGDGVVGRVMSVTENSAKVISMVDESNKIGFQVFRDLNLLGICTGDGEGGLSGYLLDDDAVVNEGDRLVTSGIGGIYPEGLIIGKVTDVEWTHDSPLKNVTIDPAVDFKSIKQVAVLL